MDAEFANHHDMKSQKGGVINLGGGTGIPDQPDKKSIQKKLKKAKNILVGDTMWQILCTIQFWRSRDSRYARTSCTKIKKCNIVSRALKGFTSKCARNLDISTSL